MSNDAQGVTNVIDALRRGSRSDATDPVAEAIALQELEDLQAAAGAGAHGLSRHGAETTIEEQYLRATRGVRPDQNDALDALRPTTSSRSTSHVTHRRLLQEAQDIATAVGREDVWIRLNDGRVVGEIIERFGRDYQEARWIRVSFEDGNWITNSFFLTDASRRPQDLVRTIQS